jgi:hypothetical protein
VAGAISVCRTSESLLPGETITVEYPVVFPERASVGHVGLQFQAELSLWESMLSTLFKRNEQWTSTMFIWPPSSVTDAETEVAGAQPDATGDGCSAAPPDYEMRIGPSTS